jgi:hypothetical protein
VDDGTDFWGNRKLGRSEKKGDPARFDTLPTSPKGRKRKKKKLSMEKAQRL